MKRFLSMLISFVLICSFSLNVFAQDGSSSGYLTIPQYNEKYSARTDGFLSLQEYNNKYSHGESPIIGNEVPNSQNVAPFRISPVKEQMSYMKQHFREPHFFIESAEGNDYIYIANQW